MTSSLLRWNCGAGYLAAHRGHRLAWSTMSSLVAMLHLIVRGMSVFQINERSFRNQQQWTKVSGIVLKEPEYLAALSFPICLDPWPCWSPGETWGQKKLFCFHSSYLCNGLVTTWRRPYFLQICLISQWKSPWNAPPWPEIESGAQGGHRVRHIRSPNELPWPGPQGGQTMRYIHSPTELPWLS